MPRLALKSVANALMGLFKFKSNKLVSKALATPRVSLCRKPLGEVKGVDVSEEVMTSIMPV